MFWTPESHGLKSCMITDIPDPNNTISDNNIGSLPESNAKVFEVFNSPLDLGKLQRDDPKLKPLITFIETDVLPENDDKLCKKIIIERDFYYMNEDMIQCRINNPRRKAPKDSEFFFENDERIVLPEVVINDVLHGYHNIAHIGITRLGATVARKYYFTIFFQKVHDFC